MLEGFQKYSITAKPPALPSPEFISDAEMLDLQNYILANLKVIKPGLRNIQDWFGNSKNFHTALISVITGDEEFANVIGGIIAEWILQHTTVIDVVNRLNVSDNLQSVNDYAQKIRAFPAAGPLSYDTYIPIPHPFQVFDIGNNYINIIDGQHPDDAKRSGLIYYKDLIFTAPVFKKQISKSVNIFCGISEQSNGMGTGKPRYTPYWYVLDYPEMLTPTAGFAQHVCEVIYNAGQPLKITQKLKSDIVAPDTWQQYGVNSEFMLEWNYDGDGNTYDITVSNGQVVITGLAALTDPEKGVMKIPVESLSAYGIGETAYIYLEIDGTEIKPNTEIKYTSLIEEATRTEKHFYRQILWTFEIITRNNIAVPVITRHFAGPVIISDIDARRIDGYKEGERQALTQLNGDWKLLKFCCFQAGYYCITGTTGEFKPGYYCITGKRFKPGYYCITGTQK